MSGNYRSKKEAAYLLVPAIGRRVFDLGGNLEKGANPFANTSPYSSSQFCLSSHIQIDWQLNDLGLYRSHGRGYDNVRKVWIGFRHCAALD